MWTNWPRLAPLTTNNPNGGGHDMGQSGTSCLRCHILMYIDRQCGPIVPGQYHWPPITPIGGAWHGTKWDVLPEMPYTYVHWQTMWTNCPRPVPLTTNNPYGGGAWHGTRDKVGCLPQVGIYTEKKFGTTTKCSSQRDFAQQNCPKLHHCRRISTFRHDWP